MQPEISLRCASCGASAREPAMFCPECGKPLTRPASGDNAAPPSPTITVDSSWTGPELVGAHEAQPAAPPSKAVDSSWTAPELVGTHEAQPAAPPSKAAVEPVKAAVEPVKVNANPLKTENKPNQTNEPVTRERTREKFQRASSVARGALEDNVKRVEKIHHVSTAMLEEAAYDPSLRFVLVALALFVVFVILLVLSKVMG